MIKSLIFDLSEVLIRGIVGVEDLLTDKLNLPRDQILKGFGGDPLVQLCLGQISEDDYLNIITKKNNWSISCGDLKDILRENFTHSIKGMVQFTEELSVNFDLLLLSDHCAEWINFIEEYHSFLKIFSKKYYSFQSESLKTDPGTFIRLIKDNKYFPQEFLLIDDNPNNIKTAEKAGMNGINFIDRNQLQLDLKKQIKSI